MKGTAYTIITSWLLWRPVIFWTTMKEWIIHMHMTSMLLTQINPKICNYLSNSHPYQLKYTTNFFTQKTHPNILVLNNGKGNSTARYFDFCEQVEARLLPFHLLRHPLPPKLLPGVWNKWHHRRRRSSGWRHIAGLLLLMVSPEIRRWITSWGWVVEIPLFTGVFSHHPWCSSPKNKKNHTQKKHLET